MYVPLYRLWNKPCVTLTPCLSSLSRDRREGMLGGLGMSRKWVPPRHGSEGVGIHPCYWYLVAATRCTVGKWAVHIVLECILDYGMVTMDHVVVLVGNLLSRKFEVCYCLKLMIFRFIGGSKKARHKFCASPVSAYFSCFKKKFIGDLK